VARFQDRVAVGVIADLTVDGAADSLVRAALDRRGRVDVLVNNAGMTSVSSGWDADDDVAEMSLAAWDAALAGNLTTALTTTCCARQAGELRQKGNPYNCLESTRAALSPAASTTSPRTWGGCGAASRFAMSLPLRRLGSADGTHRRGVCGTPRGGCPSHVTRGYGRN
jgi:NAD(P)-dependent dehydrogenase (short-subunit alcohol dehydrogenase family)